MFYLRLKHAEFYQWGRTLSGKGLFLDANGKSSGNIPAFLSCISGRLTGTDGRKFSIRNVYSTPSAIFFWMCMLIDRHSLVSETFHRIEGIEKFHGAFGKSVATEVGGKLLIQYMSSNGRWMIMYVRVNVWYATSDTLFILVSADDVYITGARLGI